MSATEVAVRPPAHTATLFNGATPAGLIEAATEAANALHDVIRQKRLYQPIGGREHVLVEGWQACGTLVGVFAIRDGGVVQLPWPELVKLPEEPPRAGAAAPPKASADFPVWEDAKATRDAWERHRDLLGARNRGLAYGFAVAYRAVKDGREVGWGEGRCTRAERNWMTRDDYALASMAQTRGQSRALRQPLGFIVSLAGYATTPADELDGVAPEQGTPSGSTLGSEVDEDTERKVWQAVQEMHPGVDGPTFVAFVNRQFGTERLPEAAARMALAIQWALGAETVQGNETPEGAPA